MEYILILIPFLALILFNLFPEKARGSVAFYSSIIVFIIQCVVAVLIPFGYLANIASHRLENLLGFNLVFSDLSAVLLLATGIVGLASILVGRNTIQNKNHRFDFYNILMIALIGINGIAFAADIFAIYIFIEATALSSFILVAFYRDMKAYEGAFKYLVLSVVASVLMLTGIALFLITAGNTSFPAIKHVVESGTGGFLVKAGIAFFMSGLFIKGGMVPFHGWLPDAYTSAPAPVSVFLAGIVTKASGLFALVKLCTFVFGFSLPVKEALMFVGTASIIVGALAALGQKNMKRMLAYSSISQMGYIVLSLGTGTKLGIIAAMFHFFNHAIFKAQLFANSAALEEQVATRNMDEMGGLGAKMPTTATTSIIAMLSTCGIPPLAGFWSKLLIVIALWVSGYQLYAGIAILASVITLAYFLSLQRRVFFGKPSTGMEGVKEANFGLLLPALFLAGINIFVGLMFIFPSTWKMFLR